MTAWFLLASASASASACGDESSDGSPEATTGQMQDDDDDSSPADSTTGGDGETSDPSAESSSNAESSGEDDQEPIGTLIRRGSRSLDQSTVDPPACDTACAELGGSCDDARAGRSYYDCETYSRGGAFYSCGSAEEAAYYDADDEFCELTEYSCECHDVPLEEPKVEVPASEGQHTCDAACTSWSLVCTEGGGVYNEFGEWLFGIDCTAVAAVPAEGWVVCDCVD